METNGKEKLVDVINEFHSTIFEYSSSSDSDEEKDKPNFNLFKKFKAKSSMNYLLNGKILKKIKMW